MTGPDAPLHRSERERRKLRIARLEADLAYFEARLELLGEPRSTNQQAQRRVFQLLCEGIGARLAEERQRLSFEP
jgi:hypothetical protein